MTHLSKRINRLEAQRGGDAGAGPDVVFIAEAEREAMAALFVGGSGASRMAGEPEASFISRAVKAASIEAHRGDI